MNRPDREWEIKLSLLGSIARSQEALARMLENAADITELAGSVPPALLREHIRVLDGMQAALVRVVTGTGWRPPKRGTASRPWLRRGICPSLIRQAGGVDR